MSLCPSLNSPGLFICLLAVVGGLSATEAKPDEPGKATNPAADSMLGKEPGQMRDDNGLRMKLIWCPPGEFTMGSPTSEADRQNDERQVEVTLTNGFWLGKYEITQSEWKQVMATEPWQGQELTKEADDFPATFVNWDDAVEFCHKLTERERKAGRVPEGWEYTLPTEAQWERVCRAQTETSFSFGADESKLGEYAWFDDNTGKAGESYARQVGQKKPNPWGLHDMHGNVWEWCRDWYAVTRPRGRDPEVTEDGPLGLGQRLGSCRVLRGGGWSSSAGDCRSANRRWRGPSGRSFDQGFRVSLSRSWNNPSIAERLGRKISVEFKRTPMFRSIADVCEQTGVQIKLDRPGLKEVGFTEDEHQMFSMKDVPATAVLHRMLGARQLVLVVDETNKTVTVTSQPVVERNQLAPLPLEPAPQE